MNRFQLAAVTGAHPDTIARWEREGLPVAQRGSGSRPSRYRLTDAVPWIVGRERARADAASGTVQLDMERARLAKVQARRTELDVQRREGELVAVADVTAVVGEMLAAVRANLLALPSALAPRLLAVSQDAGGARLFEALLREQITGALRELAAWRPPGREASA